ncbi:MAG: hypothetical protein GQ535_17025 [Rhodobacteraceae bacterium]|nr:hypothetical protein [Paracoccaceae bacterium]
MSESPKEWHYLDVCRGRILCLEHGAFCDSSDDYQAKCPLCSEPSPEDWINNPVDRGLQIMRNLQNRSSRNASIVAGLFAAISALLIFGPGETTFLEVAFGNSIFAFVGIVAMIMGMIAIGFFLFSMSHMKTTCKDDISRCHKFSVKTIKMWESHIAKKLSLYELLHKLGILAFGFAILIVILGAAYSKFVGVQVNLM